MDRPILSLVTNRHLYPAGRMIESIASAARAGVTLVQVRERDLDDRALLRLVREVVDAVTGSGARVLVNDRTDVALAAGAHGVHLRSSSVAAWRVRQAAPAPFLIGRSVHDVAEAREAERLGGCDYLTFGTVFDSASKPAGHPVAGPEGLAGVCRAVSLPVLAIGGVSVERARQIAGAGAAGVAAIGLFAGAGSMTERIESLRRAFDSTAEPGPP